MFALIGAAVAVLTVDLIGTGMYFMAVVNRLLGLIILAPSQAYSSPGSKVSAYHKQYDGGKGDVGFVSPERQGLQCRNTVLIIGQLFKIAVYLQEYQRYNG